jgi:recombination DNA repair RAD52 pathway protein
MLNDKQYEQLLKPLNPARIAKRSGGGRQLSYLEAWDVKAHLNRIFGFLNWSSDVIESSLAFEEKNEKGQWHIGYKVTLRLSISGSGDEWLRTTYTESAVGFSTLPSRGEAHDMAIKTAESDALKRAAINLGTQFGLSLYNNGSPKDVVGTTLDRDSVDNVVVVDPVVEEEPEDNVWITEMTTAVEAKSVPDLLDIKKRMNDNGVNDLVYQGVTLAKWLDKAVISAGKK